MLNPSKVVSRLFSKLRSFFIVLLVVLSVLVSSQAVFSTPVSPWTQLGADIDGEAVSDASGYSVAMSDDGSRVAIGATYNDGNVTDSGHVRIYSWNGTAWTQLGADIDGEAADDRSGSSVAMSSDGSRVAIGAYANDGNGNNSGHVRIYSWNGTAWTQLGADIDGEAADDLSGYSVAMSDDGSRVAIGGYSNDGNGNNSGHVRVYESLILASLSFDAISGANGPETITNVGGSSVTIPETEPTLNGQIFQGWNTKSDGTGTPYDAGDLITMPGAGQTLTLYASWAAPPTTTTTTTTIPPTTTTEASAESGDDPAYAG